MGAGLLITAAAIGIPPLQTVPIAPPPVPLIKSAPNLSPSQIVAWAAYDAAQREGIVLAAERRGDTKEAALLRTEFAKFQYLSFHSVPKADRAKFRIIFRYVFNHTVEARNTCPEYDVPGTDEALAWINLADAPNQTRRSWNSLSSKDHLFWEPAGASTFDAQYLRLLAGTHQDQTTKTPPVGVVVDAYALWRRLLETQRDTDYYDLLYARERHPDSSSGHYEEKSWEGGTWTHPGPDQGKTFAKGSFTYRKWVWDAAAPQADFPTNAKEFLKRWDADPDPAKYTVDPAVGGIAAGMNSGGKSLSFVALQDRVVEVVQTPWGWASRTYDFKENVGKKDPINNIDGVVRRKLQADAGEIIAMLPNGSLAYLLVAGKDEKRVEKADTDVALIRDRKIDPKFVDVRTSMGCMGCHERSQGFINFRETFRARIESGLKANAYSPDEARKIKDFLVGWEDQVQIWQAQHRRFSVRVTTTPEYPQGWSGTQIAEAIVEFRDKYDEAITLDTASREWGVNPLQLQKLLLDNGLRDQFNRKYTSPDGRVSGLAVELPTPRRTWERSTSRNVGLLLELAGMASPENSWKNCLRSAIVQYHLGRQSSR